MSGIEPTPPPNDDAQAAARAAAETRRRRILEQSSQRMEAVGGGGAPAAAASTDDKQAAAAAASSSKAARIHAMRRRRYGNKKQQVTSEPKMEEEKEDKETKAEETTETKSTSADVPATSSTEATTAATTTTTTGTTTRKYQGVAKMRRKMIKEKQQQEAAAKEKEDSIEKPAVPLTVPATVRIPLVHVFFQALAVVLLFLSGLNIGMQHDPTEVVVVHRELSPRTNGVGLLLPGVSTKMDPSDLFRQDAAAQGVAETEVGTDEFSEGEDEKKDEDSIDAAANGDSDDSAEEDVKEEQPNIDPLFQVDLDQLTRGDTLFMAAARGAVYLHRCNLYLFYYLPKQMFATLLTLPNQLLSTPPIIMLLALSIRQVTQRLGGKVTLVEQDKQSKDVLAMLKNMVINFLMGMFPTVVALYDVWTHLRSDIYVVMCGFFVGVAYLHSTTLPVEVVMEESVMAQGEL